MIHEDIGGFVKTVGGAVGGAILGTGNSRDARLARVSNLAAGPFTPGADIEIVPSMDAQGRCPPGSAIARDACTGEIYCKKTRKRRKRLLTCGDKADIAFVIGTLGKGQIAQTAIASLLARCG